MNPNTPSHVQCEGMPRINSSSVSLNSLVKGLSRTASDAALVDDKNE